MPFSSTGGHIARAVRLDELCFADRLARHKGGSRDRPRQLLDRVGLFRSAHEGGACRLGRPVLPQEVLRRNRLAEIDVAPRDQDVDGVHLDGLERCGRRRLVATTSGEQRRNAAGGNRNHENNKTRGFHTLHFPQ